MLGPPCTTEHRHENREFLRYTPSRTFEFETPRKRWINQDVFFSMSQSYSNVSLMTATESLQQQPKDTTWL